MKRLLFLLTAAVLVMACEGPEGKMGPAGPAGYNGQDGKDGRDGQGANWHHAKITVHESEWELRGNPGDLNSYFFAYKPLKELDEQVYRWGSVIAYMELEPGIKNGMPYVFHRGAEENGKEFIWTQTYDFDFDPGGVGFYVTYSDFSTNLFPETETFHIVLMW